MSDKISLVGSGDGNGVDTGPSNHEVTTVTMAGTNAAKTNGTQKISNARLKRATICVR